jgi:hypothetical protein
MSEGIIFQDVNFAEAAKLFDDAKAKWSNVQNRIRETETLLRNLNNEAETVKKHLDKCREVLNGCINGKE